MRPSTGGADDALFARYRARLAPREGGYAEFAGDRGGATNAGISQRTLDALRADEPGRGLPARTKDLSPAEIDAIYREIYFDRPGIAALAVATAAVPALAEQVFDAGVLHGPGRAAEWLQQAINDVLGDALEVDGVIGPATRATLAGASADELVAINEALVDRRLAFMRDVARNDKDQAAFLAGWRRRAESFRARPTISVS